jgi:uncharacterized protein involved in exopolysaccharide biosynthesis
MPDLFNLLGRWWKQIAVIMILSVVTVVLISFLNPPKYLSVTTAVAVNPGVADKASVFNKNIQEIYSALGSPDELDRIVGTGQLDTIYLAVTDQFNLIKHYLFKTNTEITRIKAATMLRKNSKVMKSEYGELQVKVWDKDRQLAAQLANTLMTTLATLHQNIQNETNRSVLASLQKARAGKDSVGSQQWTEYDQLINQYQMMVAVNPGVLRIVEVARPAIKPDRPGLLLILIATLFLSLVFGLAAALVLERRTKS